MDTEEDRNENHQQESSFSYSMLENEMQSDSFIAAMDGNNSHYASEINRLRLANKQLKADLQAEQDTVLQMRKKLNNAEKQKLEAASKANSEVASLETQVAKYRSQLEKGEAVRHNLEFELTKSQREVNQIKQTAREKESFLKDGTDDLKQKIGDLGSEVKQLQKSLQTCKSNAQEQEGRLRQSLEEAETKVKKTYSELDTTRAERDKMSELCRQHSNVIAELNEKLQEFENEKRSVLESLRRATVELDYAKEREDRLTSDLEAALSRNRTLEENIEAERAAHLETKFNSEIVQLRVRDLDGAIDVEKSANTEANKAIERITQQNRELEQVYEEERKNRKELTQKLDKLEKEHMSVRRQLSAEVEEKKAVIGNLSKELESHQKNFNELKAELTKAKKRQQQLEEMYSGCIKELEFLLHTFHFDDKKLRLAKKEEPASSSKGKKVTNPAVVVESFKQMLMQLKRKMDTQTDELMKTKKTNERLNRELESCREMIKAKDKTIEETQRNYTKTAKDLNKSRSSYAELESTIGKLKTSLQANANNQDKDRTRIQELSEEIMKLVKRHRAEEEEKIAFLHGLYQRLLSSHITVPTRDKSFNQFAWLDLTEVVYEQVTSLVDLLHMSDEKLRASQDSGRVRDETTARLRQEHEEQISRLTALSRDREAAWQQQKEELEQHYTQMLSDMQSRSKKTQVIADQAWEKVRATGSLQQGLESELVELRRELAESQVQASSLLSACALLSGAFYPLYSRASMLASERYILEDLYYTWETCRDRALYLCSVLRSGKDSDQDKPERDRRSHRKVNPLLRFRVGVIAVLAANRLAYLGEKSTKCFVSYNSGIGDNGLCVCVGRTDQTSPRQFKGLARQFGDDEKDDENSPRSAADIQSSLCGWLNSQDLLETVVSSMADLYEATRQYKNPNNQIEMRSVAAAARSSFSKFVDRLSNFFPETTLSTPTSMRDRASLQRKLEKHLSRILSETSPEHRGTLVSSQELMSSLQNHILDLTQRLHSAEKERRHLLAELSELKQQIGEESNNSAPDSEDKQSSSKHSTKYVSMSKFERVCVELSSALRREQKAQQLLQEQSQQLSELTSRLDLCASEGVHKQSNLVQAQETLTEVQNELKHKDQSLRQANKELAQTEYERESLQSNLRDAENALRTAARDKEILAQYIRSVENALEKAKKQFIILKEPRALTGDQSLSRLLLDADLIPQDIGRAGPDLIAVQNLVGSFVDAQHQAVSKIKSLEEEIMSHRSHIDTLKRELSNAMQREFNEHLDEVTDGVLSSMADQRKSDVFVPLKEDPDQSVGSPPSKPPPQTLLSPPVYQSSTSAFHSVKSNSSAK
ncbi:coiled-coil domain-containing protein 171 isoform X2 [Aplysia californica]|nr:coiled-coil domain-containing protein 171 isoform X2 [Aplysia californica]XP_005092063.1 coiled-coil domain-containing protein 171 isoform X2 [Aplysia californica]